MCKPSLSVLELKIGFGMEQMSSDDFLANAFYFSLGVLAYNTTQAHKLLFMEKAGTGVR